MVTTTTSPPRDWREARRLRAWELKQQGWPQRTIAAALGVTPGAVSQWLKRASAGGVEALRNRIRPGPTPRLTPEQRVRIPELLARGAERLHPPGWLLNLATCLVTPNCSRAGRKDGTPIRSQRFTSR